MVRDDLLYPLDDFLTETEAGQVLYASFSEMFWQAMRCEGHIYGFRCVDPQMYYDATLLVRKDYSSALQQYEEISSIQDLGDILEHLAKTSPDSLQDTLGVYVDIDALCNLEGYIPVINGYTGLYFTEEMVQSGSSMQQMMHHFLTCGRKSSVATTCLQTVLSQMQEQHIGQVNTFLPFYRPPPGFYMMTSCLSIPSQ